LTAAVAAVPQRAHVESALLTSLEKTGGHDILTALRYGLHIHCTELK
jgi:hypothetical protein